MRLTLGHQQYFAVIESSSQLESLSSMSLAKEIGFQVNFLMIFAQALPSVTSWVTSRLWRPRSRSCVPGCTLPVSSIRVLLRALRRHLRWLCMACASFCIGMLGTPWGYGPTKAMLSHFVSPDLIAQRGQNL